MLGNSPEERQSVAQERSVPLRAMAHPLRLRILSVLTGAELGASDVAAELEISNASASYHLRELAAAGLIEVIEPGEGGERPVGRPPIRYRYVTPERLDRSQGRDAVFAVMLQDLTRRFALMKSQHRIADAEVWLPEAAWREICELSDRISELMHAEAVPPRSPGALHTSITLSLFGLGE